VPLPGVVNGRLDKDGEIDRYRVKALFRTKTPVAMRSSQEDVGQPKCTVTSRPESSSSSNARMDLMLAKTPGATTGTGCLTCDRSIS
jgi:hypothetical protein